MPALPESRPFVSPLPPYTRMRRGVNLKIACKITHNQAKNKIKLKQIDRYLLKKL